MAEQWGSRDVGELSSVTDGPPGAEAFLVLGETDAGRIVHVDEVARGLYCGCICPLCRSPLTARKGEVRTHHFAHLPGKKCEPSRAIETGLRGLVKQVIEEEGRLALPPVVAEAHGLRREVAPVTTLQLNAVRLENVLGGRRHDIVVKARGRSLLVEVAVGRLVAGTRLAAIRDLRHAAIQIDLTPKALEAGPAQLREWIVVAAPRRWLFNAKLEAALVELQGQRKPISTGTTSDRAETHAGTSEEQFEEDLAAVTAALNKMRDPDKR